MTQRLRGIGDDEATGATKDLFDASNQKAVGVIADTLVDYACSTCEGQRG